MSRKLALKRLTASDLTFFEWHFRNHNAGNQKAINLNADVFVEELFRALPEVSIETRGKIPIRFQRPSRNRNARVTSS